MQFEKVTLETILGEVKELESDWLDEAGRNVVKNLKLSVAYLTGLQRTPTVEDLQHAFEQDPIFLDVCRLFMGVSQESAAHTIGVAIGKNKKWTELRKLARSNPEVISAALENTGLPAIIAEQLKREWKIEDVLLERYKMSRGRAISGQTRGRSLENQLEKLLTTLEIPFIPRATFTGKKGQTAKCDFAIPTKEHPKIVIECKGYETTGSKLTDSIGDVLKIGQAKDFHMYFFVVTDGRGWLNRESDLKKIIEYHNDGVIDMIYTVSRLPDLITAIQTIIKNE